MLAPPVHNDAQTVAIRSTGDGQPFMAQAIIANPPVYGHLYVAEKLGIPVRHLPYSLAYLHVCFRDLLVGLVLLLSWEFRSCALTQQAPLTNHTAQLLISGISVFAVPHLLHDAIQPDARLPIAARTLSGQCRAWRHHRCVDSQRSSGNNCLS